MSKTGKMSPVVNESSRMGCYDMKVSGLGTIT